MYMVFCFSFTYLFTLLTLWFSYLFALLYSLDLSYLSYLFHLFVLFTFYEFLRGEMYRTCREQSRKYKKQVYNYIHCIYTTR